jgi:hypothetical protein
MRDQAASEVELSRIQARALRSRMRAGEERPSQPPGTRGLSGAPLAWLRRFATLILSTVVP